MSGVSLLLEVLRPALVLRAQLPREQVQLPRLAPRPPQEPQPQAQQQQAQQRPTPALPS